MRIDAVRILNYRGIKQAEIDSLGGTPVVSVSGPNGAGKSLLLEAVASIWQQHMPNAETLVGPWGESAEVEICLLPSGDERAAIADFSESNVPERPVLRTTLHQNGTVSHLGESGPVWKAFRNRVFQREHPFSRLDFLPADRTIPRRESASVNPALLGEEKAAEMRQQVLQRVLQGRQVVQLSGVLPYLASLDYLELVAEREGIEPPNDFDIIAQVFQESTGKEIQRPRLNQAQGASIQIGTPSGAEHTVDELSSGEQEVLGLMYFVRRLSAQGGVLLIDEPELHLHPALQRSLFSVIETVAGRAQVWISTHSPKLIAAAPLRSLLHMTVPVAESGVNQLSKASDALARLDLITELGMSPVELLQSDVLLVVEGATDAHRLAGALPIEMGRVAVHEAGGAAGVEAVARTLTPGDAPIPSLCIRDRDLLSAHEVEELKSEFPNLFVWPERTIENEFLDVALLHRTLVRAGREVEESDVEQEIRALADEQIEEIVAQLVEKRLRDEHDLKPEAAGSPLERSRTYLNAAARVATDKKEAFDEVSAHVKEEVEDSWEKGWHRLMDGKRVLGQYLPRTPFQRLPDLLAALEATIAAEPDLMPHGIVQLRDRLAELRANARSEEVGPGDD